MENIPEPSSYKETLDQLLEFKKLAYNLEKEVNKKENERQKFIQLYNDLKDLHQKVQSQNNDFREQIIKLLEEKKSIENKYKNENKLLKENLENQKENYEKLLRINNQFEENTLKKKIESETESRYSTLLNEKDIENRDLSDKVNNLMKENVKLETEYDEYKKQTKSEIERLNEKYDKDIKEMINKFNEYKSNLDNIIIKPNENEISPLLISELRTQLNQYKEQIKKLSDSNENLKNQNNIISISTKAKEDTYKKELEAEKYKNNLQSNQITQLVERIENYENELYDLRNAIEIAKNGLINLQNEKEDLINTNNILQTQIDTANNELTSLKKLINQREEEMNDTILNYRNQNQRKFYEERQNVSFYQKEIEELNLSLKKIKADFKDYIDNTNNEKNENEKIYNKLLEEKKNLIKRINELQIELEYLRGDYENKIRSLSHFENEYYMISDKYKNLYMKMMNNKDSNYGVDKSHKIKEKNEKENENKVSNDYNKNENYYNKYKETLKKKNFYKEKCKEFNEIINKMNPDEKKEFENLLTENENNNINDSKNESIKEEIDY